MKIKAIGILSISMFLLSCGENGIQKERDYSSEIGELAAEKSIATTNSTKKPGLSAPFGDHLTYSIIRDHEILAAQRNYSGTLAQVRSGESVLKTQLTGNALAGISRDNLNNSAYDEGAAVSMRLSRLMYDGGNAESNIAAAEINVYLAKSALQLKVNEVATSSAAIWIETWRLQSDIRALKDLKSDLDPHVEQIKRMSNSGLVDRSISDMIDGRLIEFEVERNEKQAQLNIQKAGFEKHFGSKAWNLHFPDTTFPVKMLKKDFYDPAQTPIVRQEAFRVLLAREKLKIAKSKLSPSITIEGQANSPMERDQTPSARIGINMAFNLFDGGKRKSDIDAAEREVEQSEFLYFSTKDNTHETIQQLKERIAKSKASFELIEDKIRVLKNQLMVAQTQIQTGNADVAKVFSTKVQKYQMESNLRAAQAEMRIAEYQLAAVLGAFEYPDPSSNE